MGRLGAIADKAGLDWRFHLVGRCGGGAFGNALKTYVIGGMAPDLRELLYRAGLAMDAARIHWTILSAFRDDYRQSLASGLKAHINNSLHGASAATADMGTAVLSISKTQTAIPMLYGIG
jgi:hypothetical protein